MSKKRYTPEEIFHKLRDELLHGEMHKLRKLTFNLDRRKRAGDDYEPALAQGKGAEICLLFWFFRVEY